jgi:hypothetical protein
MTACQHCKFFVYEAGPYGQCHYQPPAPIWARVGREDWCGQFAAAPAAPLPVLAPAPLPVRRKGGAA